jgi:hypothetical protein
MLATPTGLDEALNTEGDPEQSPDPVSEFAEDDPQREQEVTQTEEDPNASTEENAEASPDGEQEIVSEQDSDPASQETDEDRLMKMRLRPRNKLDQQVIDLYKSEGFEGTFQEASDVIYGRQQQSPEPTTEQRDDPAPDDAVSKELDSVQDEIKAKEKELSDAMEDFDQVKVTTLNREITQLEIKKARVEDRIERSRETAVQNEERTLRQQSAESRERAVQKYPVLNDPESMERKQFDAFLQQQAKNPAIAPILQSPLWPEVMADRFAAQTKLAPKSGEPSPESSTTTTAKKAVTGTKAKQLTTGKTAQPEQTVTKEGLRRDVKKMSKEQLENLLGKKAS